MKRLYLRDTLVTPRACLDRRGAFLIQGYMPRLLEDLWAYSSTAVKLIFVFNEKFYMMPADNVSIDQDARMFIEDYLIFDNEDAAIAAAYLS